MIPATTSNPIEKENEDNTAEFNIETVVTQEDIDAIDREELTEEELALLDAVQASLLDDTPPMS